MLWLGSQLDGFGDSLPMDGIETKVALVGAINQNALILIIEEAQVQEYICSAIKIHRSVSGTMTLSIVGAQAPTFKGWELINSIRSGKTESNIAFMAMPFGNTDLDDVFIKHWKPVVERAGYVLERLDERQTAGSIDDRLRQTIRRSAFLICELTNANLGAYWESGFAEGIGIPVIYTCKAENHKQDSHFDVNHHLCVIWETKNLQEKSEELTSIIKETFKSI